MEKNEFILVESICQYHNIDPTFIESLIDLDLVKVIKVENFKYFKTDDLVQIEKMIRLHIDLGINLEGIDVVVNLLNQIEILEEELRSFKKRLSVFE
ncbi:MAG: chaperone modulator CbpM [Saprospiraceae bacterium]|jgi:hypothetical protein|nr:chaperone modulator CbpM [Saprospiraceae bacterium]